MEGLRWEVRRQGVQYGGRGDVALQPGGDARCEVGGVARGQEEAGVVAAEPAEEVRGLLEQGGGGAGRARYRGEGFAAGLLVRFLGAGRGVSVRLWPGWLQEVVRVMIRPSGTRSRVRRR